MSLSLFLDSVSFVFFQILFEFLFFVFRLVWIVFDKSLLFSVCGFSVFIVTGFLFFAFSSSVVHFRVVFAMFF